MNNNPVLQILKDNFKNKKIFQSILINVNNSTNIQEIIEDLISIFFDIKNENLSNFKNKIKNNSFNNVKYIGDGQKEITKIELTSILDEFNYTSVTVNKEKFYIVLNAENLKKEAANSILKFLEEPFPNVFAILFTKKIELVLPTIKSRCQIYNIISDFSESLDNPLSELISEKNKKNILLKTQIFKDMDLSDFSNILEETYNGLIIKNEPKLIIPFLEIMEDLKTNINPKIAIEAFFIKISKEI